MKTAPRILIVEDELPMRTALADCLTGEGYRVLVAAEGEAGFNKALAESPDLIVLDVMMPRLDGFALCAELRRAGRVTPVLMLTAKGRVEDRVKGLDCGADDYLVKPFSREELLARIRALLRRTTGPLRPRQQVTFGEVRIDFLQRRAWRDSEEVHLTGKEMAMLELMAAAAGETISRDRFLDAVWGYTAFPTTRTVDKHIVSLRNKLEETPDEPRWIKTVFGIGYRLELEETKNSSPEVTTSSQLET
jgi:DNA-binding response OmpR family regulator